MQAWYSFPVGAIIGDCEFAFLFVSQYTGPTKGFKKRFCFWNTWDKFLVPFCFLMWEKKKEKKCDLGQNLGQIFSLTKNKTFSW